MFKHIYLARLKCHTRDKTVLIWTLIFPIILATFFGIAFSNLYSGEIFNKIDVAIVDNEAYRNNQALRNALQSANNGDSPMFNITVTQNEDAINLLDDSKVSAVIDASDDIKLIVKSEGMDQTIIKSFLDQFKQTSSAVTGIISNNPTVMNSGFIDKVADRQDFINNVPIADNKKPDATLNFFYALIAMTCLYCSFLGLKEVNDIQANLSKQGARINLAPVNKIKQFIAGFAAALTVCFAELLVLLAYLTLVIKVDFGTQIPYVLLTCFVGAFVGICFGGMVGAMAKKSIGVNIAILIGISMILSFLSGLMAEGIIYLVRKNAPILAYINPAALITDSFYSLYYYSTHTRFFINISILSLIGLLFFGIMILLLRRHKYESI